MAAFKVAAGLMVALVYAAIEPALPGRWWAKGLFYALLVWLLNAPVVLPLLGEGFAGARSLTSIGMITFALAHIAFFLVLARLIDRAAAERRSPENGPPLPCAM